jgi:Protein of unknown function (DUF1242)
MSAFFDFKSFCVCSLLSICACTYVRQNFPSLINNRHGCGLGRLVCILAVAEHVGLHRLAHPFRRHKVFYNKFVHCINLGVVLPT